MKTIKDFTPEIQAKIPQYIQNGLEGVFDGQRYNNFTLEKAEKAVNWNYEKCGYKKPIVLVAENIYETQVYFNYLVANKKFYPILNLLYNLKNNIEVNFDESKLRSQLYSQLDNQLYSQLDSQLYNQLDNQLYSQLDSQLYNQLDSQLDSQLRSQLYSQLRSQLYSQLDNQLRSQLDSQLYNQLRSQLDNQLDSQLGIYNYSYLFALNVYSDCYYQYYKFIKDEFNIPLTIESEFEECFKLQKESGIYSAIFSELVCVISKYPKKVNRNLNNDLHSVSFCSVEWSFSTEFTKFNNYFINGRNISEKLFLDTINNSLTFNDFISLKNEDEKATVITIIKERFGVNHLMKFLNVELIDEHTFNHSSGFKETQQLYKTKNTFDFLDNQPMAFYSINCPSTGSNYLLDTLPTFKTVEECAKFHRPSQIPESLKYNFTQFNN